MQQSHVGHRIRRGSPKLLSVLWWMLVRVQDLAKPHRTLCCRVPPERPVVAEMADQEDSSRIEAETCRKKDQISQDRKMCRYSRCGWETSWIQNEDGGF